MIVVGMVVNDWCVFCGLDMISMELLVVESVFKLNEVKLSIIVISMWDFFIDSFI